VSLQQALKSGVLLGDGANGTQLSERGFVGEHYDLANLLAPDLVRDVHAAYFEAGSDFVETNTFHATRLLLGGDKLDVEGLCHEGARLAREAAGPDRYVLGAIGPAGKPIEPIGSITQEEIIEVVRRQAIALVEGGVDGFMLETFVDMDEMCAAIKGVRAASDLPILASKAYIEDGEMLAEGLPGRCSHELAEMGVQAVGANCIVGPQRMLDLVRQMAESTTLPILAFPTPGLPQLVKGQVVYDTDPDYFAKASLRLVEEGATVIGGCCGTTPAHIRALRTLLTAKPPKVRPRASSVRERTDKKPLPVTEPSELAQKIGNRFVTAVEMDVPRGLNLEKLLAGARALKIAGADVINISDGARARLRMNPAAVSQAIQSRVGIEVTMHFACRDRNLLAIQSDLLGCHALGLRNILAVTGDPANIGDYPSATSVFDIDAIGLCRILKRFNDGIDLAGYSVGVQCGFTIACAYNPLAMDRALELDRLKRKADAGAQLVYTQPVFDIETAESAAADCAALGLPALIGVLPLKTGRHAEFMHNEVPGIRIPERLRKLMAEAPDDDSALSIGVEEAHSLVLAIRQCAQGLYLMPPFGSAVIAARVMQAI
jgi:methionine synthase I (cobalamin-dependent)/5,10-methylenetetrahydrofolate reductase